MWYILIAIAVFVVYFIIGVLKLRYFDLNNDGDWLMMWSDHRSCRSPIVWLYVAVIVCWLSWPLIIFSRTKYKLVDEEVYDETGKLVKTGKKQKQIVSKGISLGMILFHLQWRGFFGLKKSLKGKL